MESTTKKVKMTSVGTTLASDEGKLTAHPHLKGTTMAAVQSITMEAGTADDAFPAIIEGVPWEVDTVPIELTDGALIQATALEFMAWGK